MAKKHKKLKKKQTKQTQSSVDVSSMKEKSDKSIQDFDVLMAEITQGNSNSHSEIKQEPKKTDKQTEKSSLSAFSKKVAETFIPTMIFKPDNTELEINLLNANNQIIQLDNPTIVFYPKIKQLATENDISPEAIKGIENLTEIKPVEPADNKEKQETSELKTAENDATFTDISENDEYTIQKQSDKQLKQDLSQNDKSDIISETGSELTELEETPTKVDEEENAEFETETNREAETKTESQKAEINKDATPQLAESKEVVNDKPADGFDLFYQEQRHQYIVDTNFSILVVLSVLAILSFIGWI